MRTALMSVALVLLSAAMVLAQTTSKPAGVLIITGDHGHNWKETTPFLKEVLTKAGHKVEVTQQPRIDLIPANLAKYDVLLLNYRNTPRGAMDNPDSVWSDENKRAFAEAIEMGKGLVVFHHASSAFTGDGEWDKLFEKIPPLSTCTACLS
jgi:uncharacterized protein